MSLPTSALPLSVCAILFGAPGILAQEQGQDIPADTEIQTTESGLKYSVLHRGEGTARPKLGDKVKVHYTGWLTDGTKFDSSRDRGAPSDFVVGQVIEGWNQGLQLMSAGDRFKLTIPGDLAYGASGRPPKIPADATLVFDVELISFVSAPVFVKANPEATETTESGIKYEILKPGEGDSPTEKDFFQIVYTVWDRNGRMLDSTFQTGRPIEGKVEDMQLAFLREIPMLLKRGGVCRIEVTKDQSFGERVPSQFGDLGPEGITVWQLELKGFSPPQPVPEYSMPDASDLTTTDSGLKYQVIEEGEGESPKMFQPVKVHYAGWLTDGTLFDSSIERGSPMSFTLGQVIQGWNEGLMLMKPGAVYKFVIPPELGYGTQGTPGGPIGPDATLVFYVKLIGAGGD